MRLAGAVFLLLAGACGAAAVPVPDADLAHRAGTPLADLQRGRQVYVVRCAGCHDLYPVPARSAAAWSGVLAKMAAVAKLSADDAELVAHYLRAVTTR